MKVLITGANGMVAKAAIEYCRTINDEVVGLTRQQLDIADPDAVDRVFDAIKPEAVLNCAAYTNVDGAESDREAAYNANVLGVKNLALASRARNSAFVTISTDYVFDGRKSGEYTQRDDPNPLGVYAATKRDGELMALENYARSVVVRSGWIYGDGGTNFLSVMHRLLAEGKTIKAIHDSFGKPTYADDLAKRLRQLVDLNMPCIFHVSNSGPGTSFSEFAQKVCEIGGFDSNLVERVSMNDLKRPAPRPASSKLACLFSEKFGLEALPDWEDGLRRFLMKK